MSRKWDNPVDKPSRFPSLQLSHKAQRMGRALLGNAEEHRGVQAARDLGLPTAFLGSGPPPACRDSTGDDACKSFGLAAAAPGAAGTALASER